MRGCGFLEACVCPLGGAPWGLGCGRCPTSFPNSAAERKAWSVWLCLSILYRGRNRIPRGEGARGTAQRVHGEWSLAAPFWKTKTNQKLVFVQRKQNSYSVIASQTLKAWCTLLYFLVRPN